MSKSPQIIEEPRITWGEIQEDERQWHLDADEFKRHEDLGRKPRLRPHGDLVLRPDGYLVIAEPAGDKVAVISRLPDERMAAGDSWEEIARQLRLRENGQSTGAKVVMRPGGRLETMDEGDEDPRPLSKLPKRRMAGANPGPSSDDVKALRRLDPDNQEGWEPVDTGELRGWKFHLTPPVAGPDFAFFAFRSPSEGNTWRISVIKPNMDGKTGHSPHMISASVGGIRVPVICGPKGKPARTLKQVRGHAAKWMAYTSRRMAGLDPGFSL